MRKLFSVLSSTLQGGVRAVLFLLALFASVSTIYASDTQVDGIWYDFDSRTKTASVTYRGSSYSSYEGEYSGSVTIPETVTYNGTTYSVTSIGGEAFRDCSSLTSVTIPESVTSIGIRAFTGCSGLTSPIYNAHCFAYLPTSFEGAYTIPDGIKQIAGGAFSSCSSITSITIANSVKSIGFEAFYNCSSLTSVTIPNSVTSIESFAFMKCTSLTSVTIGNSVTSIESSAFEGCSSLTSVSIGKSVRSISQSAFRKCALLSTIVVDKNNTKYDSREECNAIIETATNTLILGCQNTTIPNSVTSIGYSAFYGCSGLTSVTIPNSVTSIGSSAFFGCSSLTSVTIGNSVTSIGYEVFYGCSSLTSVTIPNSVTSIGDYAFHNCSSLTSVTIPNSVTSIGISAFRNCSKLTSVTIGNSVTSIGNYAFEGCSSLTSVTINSNAIVNKDYSSSANISHIFGSQVTEYIIGNKVKGIGYYAFYGCSGLTSVTIPNSVTSIGKNAFEGCSSLTSITIPESVTSIGDYAFRDCKSLSNIVVDKNNTKYDSREDCNAIIETATNTFILGCQNTTIPNSVTSIRSYAFYGCSSLTSVTIPNSVTKIGGYAFYGCSGLTSVTISESVTSILNYAFYNCSKLTSVAIPNSVTSIGKYAFEDCSSLTSVTIGESVTSIGESAFAYCFSLTSVTINSDAIVSKNYSSSSNVSDIFGSRVTEYIIGDNVRGIGKYAFEDCSKLTSVTIGNSVTSIGSSAFFGCSSLTSVTIGESVTSIRSSAFSYCSSLTSVTIPNSVTSIGDYAFDDCTSLISVTIGNSVTSIGSSAFSGCSSLTSVTIPNSVTSIGNSAFYYCSSLSKTNYTGDIAGWCNIKFGNSTANPMYCSHNFYINDQEIKDLVIPNSVTSIGSWAFEDCSSLTSVTIPNSVISIGGYAFSYCSSLTSVTIPNGVTSIGSGAFEGCSSLTSVTIGESITSIGSSAFSGCSSLTSVTIPNSVTSIGSWAFEDCSSLTSVTIGNSVTSIGSSAFSGCSSLTSITCDAETPPAIGNTYTFYNVSTSIPIYVPCGCVEAYKAASGWKNFTDIQEPLAEYSIEVDVNDTIMGTAKVDRNSACGNQISATPKFGYHFVQWSDGNTDAIRTLELTQDTILTAEFAQSFSGQCGENLYWELIESTLHITGSGKMYDYTSDTAPWKVLVSSIKSLTIAEGVTSIGSYAFYNCSKLTSVAIPNSVTSIGDDAFSGCYSLPVEDNLRYADTYLVEAVDKTLSTCSIKEGTKWVGDYAFRNCSNLTSVTIPNSVTSIGGYAFRNCSSLTSVTIGESVTCIGDYAFYSCTSLTSVTIPNSVTSIGSWAFENCSSLTSVTIPNSVTSISSSVFRNCSYLTSVTINSDAIVRKNYSSSSNISDIFGSQVTEYIIGEEVKSIGHYAFSSCSVLTSVTIPNSVTSIGSSAFSGCSSLTSVTIPNSIKSIGYDAFAGCSSLTSITCEAATPPTLGSDAFDGVSKSIPVYVPCGCVEAYNTASGWEDFTNFQEPLAYSIEVNVNDTIMGTANVDYNTFCEGNQISATPNFGYHFVQWSDGNTDAIRTLELTQDTILTAEFAQSFSGQCGDDLYWNYDETAKTISITGSGKMYDYTATTQPWLLFKEQIVEVTTTNTVTSIGTSAFEGCIRLSKISLGTGLEEIAANAFAGCTRLYDIYTYATYPPFAEESSFANYNVYVYIPCEYQRDYILDVVWGKFKFIECLESEDVTTDGNVTIVPGYNDVTITWPTEDNADTYTIVIKKDGEVFCTLTFNAEGQLLNIAFAPSRDGNNRPAQYADQAVNGYRFTVTGLTEATQYAYNITTKDAANQTIATYSGEFTTMGGTTTDMDNIQSPMTNCQKILRDNQLIIVRDGVEYNAMGQEL